MGQLFFVLSSSDIKYQFKTFRLPSSDLALHLSLEEKRTATQRSKGNTLLTGDIHSCWETGPVRKAQILYQFSVLARNMYFREERDELQFYCSSVLPYFDKYLSQRPHSPQKKKAPSTVLSSSNYWQCITLNNEG